MYMKWTMSRGWLVDGFAAAVARYAASIVTRHLLCKSDDKMLLMNTDCSTVQEQMEECECHLGKEDKGSRQELVSWHVVFWQHLQSTYVGSCTTHDEGPKADLPSPLIILCSSAIQLGSEGHMHMILFEAWDDEFGSRQSAVAQVNINLGFQL
jgi:hypothetical protein